MIIARMSVFGHRIGALEKRADPSDPEEMRWLKKRSLIMSVDAANADSARAFVTVVPRTRMGKRPWSEERELPATVASPEGEANCTRSAIFDCLDITLLRKSGAFGDDRVIASELFGAVSGSERIRRIELEVAEALAEVPSRDTLRRWHARETRLPLDRKDFHRRRIAEFIDLPDGHALKLCVVLSSNYVLAKRGLPKAVVVPLSPLHGTSGDGAVVRVTRNSAPALYEVRPGHAMCVNLSDLSALPDVCPRDQMEVVLAAVLDYLGIDPAGLGDQPPPIAGSRAATGAGP